MPVLYISMQLNSWLLAADMATAIFNSNIGNAEVLLPAHMVEE